MTHSQNTSNLRIAVTLHTVTTINNNNNIPWKQKMLILKNLEIYMAGKWIL
jgi:hypothetical protein